MHKEKHTGKLLFVSYLTTLQKKKKKKRPENQKDFYSFVFPDFVWRKLSREMLAKDKKRSIFYGDEVNKLPPAVRTTRIETQINPVT